MNKIIYERTCIVCGGNFTATQYTAKTCSQKCRNTLSISRKIAGNINVITDDIEPVITPETPEIVDKTPVPIDVIVPVPTIVIAEIVDKTPVLIDVIALVPTPEIPEIVDKTPLITDVIAPIPTPEIPEDIDKTPVLTSVIQVNSPAPDTFQINVKEEEYIEILRKAKKEKEEKELFIADLTILLELSYGIQASKKILKKANTN